MQKLKSFISALATFSFQFVSHDQKQLRYYQKSIDILDNSGIS